MCRQDVKRMLKDIRNNIILLTDSYNTSHHILKENTDWETSLLYNRNKPMILYGFNEIVTSLLNTKIEENNVVEAEEHARGMEMPFPSDMWYKISNDLKGRIPLCVKSVKDGTYCPKGTPFAKVYNTIEGFGELVSWWEGIFLHASFPSGCATEAMRLERSLRCKKLRSGRVHSFGFRGHNSLENAYWAGSAWNLFFDSTDDFHMTKHVSNKLTSIPATAHKTIQQFDDELKAYTYSIDEISRAGYKTLSLVIDTYDPNRFIKHYSISIAKHALSMGVHLVFRPDSGDIKEQALLLYVKMKDKGLLKTTSCIIGESMNSSKVEEYDNYFKEMDCDLDWFSYGIGSGFYKHIDRDYLGFAMKTSYSNGQNRMKFSADKVKQSLPGNVHLKYNVNGQMCVNYDETDSIYKTIYNYDQSMSRPEVYIMTHQDIKDVISKQEIIQYDIILCGEIESEQGRLRQKYVDSEPSIIS